MAPGFAMRSARSPPVLQSAAAVVATRVTGGGAWVRTTAGVTSERTTAGATRAEDGDTYGIAGCAVGLGGTGAAWACASAPGRSSHAVVRPVLNAVTPVRAI